MKKNFLPQKRPPRKAQSIITVAYAGKRGGDTNDKVFLLSVSEVTNADYGFVSTYNTADGARQKAPTDYAKMQGATVQTSSTQSGYGNGYWWLRSPFMLYYTTSANARCVNFSGKTTNTTAHQVTETKIGVVPAMVINL